MGKSLDEDSVQPALHDCWHAEPIEGKLDKNKESTNLKYASWKQVLQQWYHLQ